nr:MAG TPA: hypothetical protein [Caudoviricetes sp.]
MVSARLVRFRPRERCAPYGGGVKTEMGENRNDTLRMG